MTSNDANTFGNPDMTERLQQTSSFKQYVISQFGHPRGLLGRLVGNLMALKNQERVNWTIDLLTDPVALSIANRLSFGVDLRGMRVAFADHRACLDDHTAHTRVVIRCLPHLFREFQRTAHVPRASGFRTVQNYIRNLYHCMAGLPLPESVQTCS